MNSFIALVNFFNARRTKEMKLNKAYDTVIIR